jgi:hypothetical protein
MVGRRHPVPLRIHLQLDVRERVGIRRVRRAAEDAMRVGRRHERQQRRDPGPVDEERRARAGRGAGHEDETEAPGARRAPSETPRLPLAAPARMTPTWTPDRRQHLLALDLVVGGPVGIRRADEAVAVEIGVREHDGAVTVELGAGERMSGRWRRRAVGHDHVERDLAAAERLAAGGDGRSAGDSRRGRRKRAAGIGSAGPEHEIDVSGEGRVEHVVAVTVLVVRSGIDQAHAGEEHPRLIGVGIDRISVEDASGRRSGERDQDRRGHRRREHAPNRSRHGASHGITAGTALLMNVSSSSRTA